MIYFDDLNVFIHPFIPKNMSETLTMCDSKKIKSLVVQRFVSSRERQTIKE